MRTQIGFTAAHYAEDVNERGFNAERVNNLYAECLIKAFREFLLEEARGESFTEKRMIAKINAARELFPEEYKNMQVVFHP